MIKINHELREGRHLYDLRVPFLPSAHGKPIFVVGSLSLGLCKVLKINDRNYGSQENNDFGDILVWVKTPRSPFAPGPFTFGVFPIFSRLLFGVISFASLKNKTK